MYIHSLSFEQDSYNFAPHSFGVHNVFGCSAIDHEKFAVYLGGGKGYISLDLCMSRLFFNLDLVSARSTCRSPQSLCLGAVPKCSTNTVATADVR